MTTGRERLTRILSTVFGVLALCAAGLTFADVDKHGIAAAAAGVVALFLSWFLLTHARGHADPLTQIPSSLQRVITVYFAFLGVIVVVTSIAMLLFESRLKLTDAPWVVLFAIFTWGVWGIMAFVLIVLPLWALVAGARKAIGMRKGKGNV